MLDYKKLQEFPKIAQIGEKFHESIFDNYLVQINFYCVITFWRPFESLNLGCNFFSIICMLQNYISCLENLHDNWIKA